MPSWTFVATAQAVIQAGYEPFFIDVDYATQTVTTNELSDLNSDILSNTALIIITSSYGFPFDQEGLINFQNERGIPVIVDGAAQIYSAAKNILPTVISLHATKLLGVGEGGLVITKDRTLGEISQSYSNFGFLNNTRSSVTQGSNAKMNEYSAAIGLSQLDRANKVFEDHMLIARSFLDKSLNSPLASFQKGWGRDWISSTAVITFKDASTKNYIVQKLDSHNIPHRNWWEAGCHDQNAFSSFKHTSLDNTKKLAQTTLGIPFHSKLTEEEIIKISSICF
jgi:dTDP-4-amino-4,6-dideoxygalactose transaminase